MIASFWRSYGLTLTMILCSLYFSQQGQCQPRASHNCATYIAQYEKHHGIPTGLLQAISKVESGRRPWTVNAEGKGYHFPTKEAAIAAVRALQLKGIKSIDVGCMQVNLYYHPYAFKNLSEAFDPEKNVKYAAVFLTRLKSEHASWDTAVSRYHSANPVHHIPYRKNVIAVWRQERKNKNVHLASATLGSTHRSSSKIVRLRRLATAQKAKLRTTVAAGASIPHTTQAVVRKVTRSSRHLKRLAKVTSR